MWSCRLQDTVQNFYNAIPFGIYVIMWNITIFFIYFFLKDPFCRLLLQMQETVHYLPIDNVSTGFSLKDWFQ